MKSHINAHVSPLLNIFQGRAARSVSQNCESLSRSHSIRSALSNLSSRSPQINTTSIRDESLAIEAIDYSAIHPYAVDNNYFEYRDPNTADRTQFNELNEQSFDVADEIQINHFSHLCAPPEHLMSDFDYGSIRLADTVGNDNQPPPFAPIQEQASVNHFPQPSAPASYLMRDFDYSAFSIRETLDDDNHSVCNCSNCRPSD